MRLHHLTATAFGPFADSVSVDFEELNDAGLFLLTGPTGAGKSSLLDAVCFALYGAVPGARGVKTLKSQHAGPAARPEVVLDFSVRDRRFVVRRTPEWSRPKKRGDGLTAEKASASITETTGGGDHFLSARAAEVGLLVTDLMGMNADQFVQVALLPQGEFQTFLRASSQDRHDVLQHLFRTNRFARIEDWVHEHSRGLRDRSGRDQADVQRLADAVAERSGTELPAGLSGEHLAPAAGDGRLLAWAAARLDEAAGDLSAAVEHRQRADTAREAAADRHRSAELARERAERRSAAAAVLDTLAETEDDATRARATLSAAERAAACRPLLGLLDQAVRAADAAETDRVRTLGSLTEASAPGPEVDTADLPGLLRSVRARATRLETLVPRERAGRLAGRDLEAARARLAEAEADLARTAARAADLPEEVAALTSRVREATARSARREALSLALETARRRHAAARELPDADALVARLADAHRDARDRLLSAREQRADLLDRRLAEMAAELAGGLTDGAACQVCGSTDHPAPAEPARDAVTAADQEAAEARVAGLTEALDAAAASLRDAEHRRDTCRTAAEGRTPDEARTELHRLTLDLDQAEAAEQQRVVLQAELDATVRERDTVTTRQSAAAATAAGLEQTVAGLEQTVRSVAEELAEVRDPATGSTLEDEVRGLLALADRVERAIGDVESAVRAVSRARELREQADETVAAHGFDTVDDARAAVLDPDRQRRLTDQLAERDRAADRAHDVLAELSAGDGTAADATSDRLEQLAAELVDADAAAREAARQLHLTEARAEAVAALVRRLDAAVLTWAPLRDEWLRAESMSRLVRGTGQDNHLQMRLSSYVLATRLDQVVAAANERLGHMRDQRYLLQRTERAARKGSQAGLGLEVVDQWTGDARDPATLSGGETFVVSLSLALGLADVVTQEAGGTEIDTLFVDEGFGTLDADTLDDVMDRLDGLRAGGRTVGVVSHVSELRNRIPTQVHVQKGRAGSTVTVATLVG
jgi:DNA repair protein SbcC/Rad50